MSKVWIYWPPSPPDFNGGWFEAEKDQDQDCYVYTDNWIELGFRSISDTVSPDSGVCHDGRFKKIKSANEAKVQGDYVDHNPLVEKELTPPNVIFIKKKSPPKKKKSPPKKKKKKKKRTPTPPLQEEEEEEDEDIDMDEFMQLMETIKKKSPPPKKKKKKKKKKKRPLTPSEEEEEDSDDFEKAAAAAEKVAAKKKRRRVVKDEEAVDPDEIDFGKVRPFVAKKRKKSPKIDKKVVAGTANWKKTKLELKINSLGGVNIDLKFPRKLTHEEMFKLRRYLLHHGKNGNLEIKYVPAKQSQMHIKKLFHPESFFIMFFPQGKLIIQGAKTIEGILDKIHLLQTRLRDLGIETDLITEEDIRVTNMQATARFPHSIKLDQLAYDLPEYVEYEPDIGHGAEGAGALFTLYPDDYDPVDDDCKQYKMKACNEHRPPCLWIKKDQKNLKKGCQTEKIGNAKIFVSGKVNFMGSRSMENLQKTFEKVKELFKKYKK